MREDWVFSVLVGLGRGVFAEGIRFSSEAGSLSVIFGLDEDSKLILVGLVLLQGHESVFILLLTSNNHY